MKKIITITLVFIMLFAQSVSAATMYSLDGRTLEVDDSEIEANRQVGWFYGKPVTMHALDGRTLTVGENDIEAYRQVGWFYGKPVTMYALDGRTLTIGENDVEMYRQVGWFYGKPVTMYASDGRTLTIGENDVEMYKAVGWYTTPMIKLYSWDGKTAIFPENEVAAQLKVGWYREPVQVLYTLDGRSAVFPKSEVAAQLTVGWYKTPYPYKDAYAEILRNNKSYGKSFSLIYIDYDNIPELVYFTNSTAYLYTFRNGKSSYLLSVDIDAYETLYYREKCNLFLVNYYKKNGAAAGDEFDVYKISNGNASRLSSFEFSSGWGEYMINDNTVSESAYFNNAKKYYLNRIGSTVWLSTNQYTNAQKAANYALNETNIKALFE